MALCLSHVFPAMVTIEIKGEIPGDGKEIWQRPDPNPGSIFPLGHIADIVDFIFHMPVIANPPGKLLDCFIQGADVVAGLRLFNH